MAARIHPAAGRILLLGVWLGVVGGGAACRSAPPPAPRAAESPKPEEYTVDALARRTESQINEADRRLDALEPDKAVELLEQADEGLKDPLMRRYPDDQFLERRHAEVLAKVPGVREEIRRRELARAVKESTEAIKGSADALRAISQRLETGDPPDDDFKAARERIGELEKHLSSGSKLESQDPPYAKFALDARKRLQKQKAYVEARHLAVSVARSRRDIQATLDRLKEALAQIRRAGPSDQDFDEANRALDTAEKSVDAGEALGPKDEKYAKYALSVRKSIQENKQFIARRLHEVTVDRQKTIVTGFMKEQSQALERIRKKDVTLAEFGEADSALQATIKALDAGEALQTKDAGYSKFAVAARQRIQEDKRTLLRRQDEVAVAAQRVALTSAVSVVTEAMKRLAARSLTDSDFEAAEGAIAGVLKVLDAGEPLHAKDAQYAKASLATRREMQARKETVSRRRIEVKIDQARTELSAHSAALSQAIEVISKEGPSDQDFAAAEAAVERVVKSLDEAEPLGSHDKKFQAFLIDLRKTMQRAKQRISERRTEVAVLAQRTEVARLESALKAALARVRSLSPVEVDFSAADEAIATLEKSLEKGEPLQSKSVAYSKYAVGLRRSVQDARKLVADRRVAMAVREQKAAVEGASAELSSAMKQARTPTAKEPDIDAARSALAALRERLEAGRELETKDVTYRKLAVERRSSAGGTEKDLNVVARVVAFRSSPMTMLETGLKEMKTGQSAASATERRDAFARAVTAFKDCRERGTALVADAPTLSGTKFAFGRGRITGKAVLDRCLLESKGAEKKLAVSERSVAFYEGPGKAFEEGMARFEAAQVPADSIARKTAYSDALARFDACVSDGELLSRKYPELGEQKFDLSQRSVTLRVVIGACRKQASAIRKTLAELDQETRPAPKTTPSPASER